jgi:antitoxin HigA-1
MAFKNGMRPVHPGEVLREEFLKPNGMTVNALAKALHLTASRVNEIARGQRGITAETALRLEQYFGASAQFWMNLQSAYDLRSAAQSAATRKAVRAIAPLEAHEEAAAA